MPPPILPLLSRHTKLRLPMAARFVSVDNQAAALLGAAKQNEWESYRDHRRRAVVKVYLNMVKIPPDHPDYPAAQGKAAELVVQAPELFGGVEGHLEQIKHHRSNSQLPPSNKTGLWGQTRRFGTLRPLRAPEADQGNGGYSAKERQSLASFLDHPLMNPVLLNYLEYNSVPPSHPAYAKCHQAAAVIVSKFPELFIRPIELEARHKALAVRALAELDDECLPPPVAKPANPLTPS